MNIPHSPRTVLSLALILLASLLGLQPLRAGSATWGASPSSGNWNTADNWTPNTIPDGTSDIATFGQSTITSLSINTTDVTVDSIVFAAGAPPYTINLDQNPPFVSLSLYGSGIVNNSGVMQSINVNEYASIEFYNSATAGQMTHLGGASSNQFGFHGSSSAESASFDLISPSGLYFYDNSTAADATITTDIRMNMYGAGVYFLNSSTAAHAVIQAINGGSVAFSDSSTADHTIATCDSDGAPYADGGISFQGSATAANGTFIAKGGTSRTYFSSTINFSDTCTAGDATFALDGGSAEGATGASLFFYYMSTAGNATFTVGAGSDGGQGAKVGLLNGSKGGTARFILNGNGTLDVSYHNKQLVKTGSIEGDGIVTLGARSLAVGRNNRSTTFSGSIEDGSNWRGGTFVKEGRGTLILSGASTYTGATLIDAGALVVSNTSGSATGTGSVAVNSGTLGGGGTISGAVTIGTGSGSGAILQPSFGTNAKIVLTIQSQLIFQSDSTYDCHLKSRAAEVVANGLTIEGGAQFVLVAPQRKVRAGLTVTIISNTSMSAISGTFANLPDGATITSGGNTFQANYEGGDGNDLTLTVVP